MCKGTEAGEHLAGAGIQRTPVWLECRMCWNGRSQTRQSLRPAEAFGTYLGPQGDYKSNQSRMSAGRIGWGRRKLVLTSENIVCFPKAFPFPSGQEELSFGAWEADHGGTGRPRGGSGTPWSYFRGLCLSRLLSLGSACSPLFILQPPGLTGSS